MHRIKIDFADGGVVVGVFDATAAAMLTGTYTREAFDIGDTPAAATELAAADHDEDLAAHAAVALYHPLYLCPLDFPALPGQPTVADLIEAYDWCAAKIRAGRRGRPAHQVMALLLPFDGEALGYVTGRAVWRGAGAPYATGSTHTECDEEAQRLLRGRCAQLADQIADMRSEKPASMCSCARYRPVMSTDAERDLDTSPWSYHPRGLDGCDEPPDSIYVVRAYSGSEL